MKNVKYLLVALIFCGCADIAFNKSPRIKEEEVANETFQYPKKDVFDACLGSLEANGWTVTASDYGAGTISGIQRPYPGMAEGTGPARHTATVSLVENASGATEVKITAKLVSPNPAVEPPFDPQASKELPKVCDPLLNSVRATLLKGPQRLPK